jgi:hypothetical protein
MAASVARHPPLCKDGGSRPITTGEPIKELFG